MRSTFPSGRPASSDFRCRSRRGAVASPARSQQGTPTAQTVIILGGGPAGLAVALYAHRAGIPFVLFERGAELGGMCRTLECGAHRYDCGAHRFHDRDAEITRDVRALLGDELAAVHAPSQIYDGGRFIDFPPSPLNWVLGVGAYEAVRVLAELVAARVRPQAERSFEDYAINRYGRRLGKRLLLDYSEKLWGLPAAELDPGVATRRLSGLGLRSLVVELLLPHRKSVHLDGAFLYPRAGYGTIATRIAASLPRQCIRTRHEVTGLECTGGRVRAVRFADRPPVEVDGRLVSTLPASLLVRFLGDALPPSTHEAAARLRFRHLRIVFLRLGVPRCSRNATIYLPDPRLCVSRISEPKNRSAAMAPEHETALVAEVPCSTGDPVHGLDDAALAERVIDELAGVGLLDRRSVREWRHHLLPNAYPVYALGYAEWLRRLDDALTSFDNLDVLGRAGLFFYSHLHDQLRLAKNYVRTLGERTRATQPESMSPHMTTSASRL